MTRPLHWQLAITVALLAFLALPSLARAAAISGRLEQCENGRSGVGSCTGSAWITGDLNPQHSSYREGDFVPVRAIITGLEAGHAYTLRIGYDAVEKGLHAYDYLGTHDASESAPGQKLVPCDGVAGTSGSHACGNRPSTLPVPLDANSTMPSGSQGAGHFSAWGANLQSAAYVSPTPITVGTTGTVEREIDVTFTAEGDSVVLAWGAHIASSLDWGAGETYVSQKSGAPFHVRVVALRESGGKPVRGHKELSMHASALAPLPAVFATRVDKQSVQIGAPVVDTATLGGQSGAPISGVVDFFVCFSTNGPPDCTVGGNPVGPGQVVASPSPGSPNGLASVQFVPAAVGSYCFRAVYLPSATAPYSPTTHTNTDTECFDARETPPRLTITKLCVPTNDPGHFNLLLDAAAVLTNAACGASTGPFNTTAGAHAVSETAGTGTDLTNYTSEISGNCAPDGSITLALGASATCFITNTRSGGGLVLGTLRVNKVCVPPTDRGLFELKIDSLRAHDVPCGGSTGPVPLPAGPHKVGEASGTGTGLSDYKTVIGGDCAADGSVTVPPAGVSTCTITNTRTIPPATLRVDKLCIPAGSEGRFSITIDGKAVATVGCGSTRAVRVPVGSHAVGEKGTAVSAYIVLQGGDCAADGTVVLEAGEQAACTITNIRKSEPPKSLPPMLTVDKICVPSDDGGLFNLKIDGNASVNQPCGHRLGPLVVSPDVHHVSEVAGTGTSLGDYRSSIGGDCAADGSVTVAAGQSASCTITNVRASVNSAENTAEITIVKQCQPAGVLARFQLNLDGQVFQGMKCGDSIGPIVTSTGDHSVGEARFKALPHLFKTVISGSCSANGAITLQPGQHATCIVTNVRRRFAPATRPPAACYRLTVARRMVNLGDRVLILALVRLHGRPVQGVRVYAVGPGGVFDVRTTGPRGGVAFLLKLRRPGILKLRVRKPFDCRKPPPRAIGVLGASQPSLTG
jgi:hypothetical protein